MPNQIISTFGSYDFFGKSIPGMGLIAGLGALIPAEILPDLELAESFVIVLSILIVIALLGVLFGEIVHSVSGFVEKALYWLGKKTRYQAVKRGIGPPKKPLASEIVLRRNPSGSNNNGEADRDDQNDSKPGPKDAARRERYIFNIQSWAYDQYLKIYYILTPHRDIFINSFTEFRGHDFVKVLNQEDAPFTKEPLLEKANREFSIQSTDDANAVYPAVVSYLIHAGSKRPFQYQARYAFCRSMSVVLMFLAICYTVVWIASSSLKIPLINRGLNPSSLDGAYILEISSGVLILTILTLVFSSFIFGFASGAYKKHYIRYLLADFYVLNKMQPPSQPEGEVNQINVGS